MDIAEEKLTEVSQMIYNKIQDSGKHSFEIVKESIRERAEELIEAS